jgi:hypothetical protein
MFKRDYGPGTKPALRLTSAGLGGVKVYAQNPIGWIVSNFGNCIPFLNLQGNEDAASESIYDAISNFPSGGLFLGRNVSGNGNGSSNGGSGGDGKNGGANPADPTKVGSYTYHPNTARKQGYWTGCGPKGDKICFGSGNPTHR